MTNDSTNSRFLVNYTAYLLRLWQDSDQAPWRASAQCARTGEKFMFAKLEDLFAFLLAQTSAVQKEIQ
jgi:hypothetical protein